MPPAARRLLAALLLLLGVGLGTLVLRDALSRADPPPARPAAVDRTPTAAARPAAGTPAAAGRTPAPAARPATGAATAAAGGGAAAAVATPPATDTAAAGPAGPTARAAASPHATATATPPWRATWTGLTVPDHLPAGVIVTAHVRVTNAGAGAWPTAAPHPVDLSYHWRTRDGRYAVYDGLRTALAAPLAPGASVDATLRLGTPAVPGDYLLVVDAIAEGLTWFSAQDVPAARVAVGADPYDAAAAVAVTIDGPAPPAGTGPTHAPAPLPTPPPLARPAVPARLRAPAIDLDAPIVPLGLTATGQLEAPDGPTSVGWWADGVRPGETGSAVLDGHLDWAKVGAAVFWRLRELRPGDLLIVVDADGVEHRFAVTGAETVPRDGAPVARIFGAGAGARLSLITCDGTFDRNLREYDHNLVVYAEELP